MLESPHRNHAIRACPPLRRAGRSPLHAGLPGLLAVLGVCCFTGCSLMYENRLGGNDFVLYSDHDEEFLAMAGRTVEEIYRAYTGLFGIDRDELGATTIIFEGNSGSTGDVTVDLSYSPRLLGYYLPLFNLISVDTIPVWTREPETLRQILSHEIAHHFLISQHPPASGLCWLNEGLAGNLETTLIEGGRQEFPLLNPPLLRIARAAVLGRGDEVSLEEFLDLDWSGFHEEGKKETHYALAWSVVNWLLTEYLPDDRPLGERIRSLYHIDADRLAAEESRWKRYLRAYDLTSELVRLAGLEAGGAAAGPEATPLTSRWAIRQLGTRKYLDRERALRALVRGFDAVTADRREACYIGFLRVASSLEGEIYPDRDLATLLVLGRDRIQEVLTAADTPASLRRILVEELSRDLLANPHWVPVFIDLLDAPEGEIRVVAAHGLGRAEIKPTILNPRFWRQGSQAARRDEIHEWRLWWSSHRPASLGLPEDTE